MEEPVQLRIVPSTQWVAVRGLHPGALVEVRRVTQTAVYFRILREGAGTGPRGRRGGPKNRLNIEEFRLNYRPNTKRDWMLASMPEGKNNGTVTDTQIDLAVSGRLHADEEAIAQAIRDGHKFHEVQRDYKVAGRILAQIIEKYGVPYQTVRDLAEEKARVKRENVALPAAPAVVVASLPAEGVPVPTEPIPDGPLHPQEDEIVELMRARAGTFQDVLRDYHVKSSTLVAIMARHGIPKQTPEEKRQKSLAAYHKRKEREAAERDAQAAQEAAQAASAPVEAPAVIVVEPAPVSAPAASVGLHTWHVTVRTTVLVTVQAASYFAAGQQVLADNPGGAEIIGVVRAEGNP